MLLLLISLGCTNSDGNEEYHFSVQNQLDYSLSETAVKVDLTAFSQPPTDCRYVLYMSGSGNRLTNEGLQDGVIQQNATEKSGDADVRQRIVSQCDDLTGDGLPNELFFLADFQSGETIHFVLTPTETVPEYEDRTQAFLKVQTGGRFENGSYVDGTDRIMVNHIDIPEEQVQGSGWAHMEGPVWESDLVGYRFYLDARNRIDIFGKSMPDLVLDTITQNYHQIHDWGTDVLVVGRSLGLGSVAAVSDGEVQTIDNWSSRRFDVTVNGPLRSIIRMTYSDWNVFGYTVDVVSEMEIHAGNRYTEQRVTLIGESDGLTLGTGIVRHPPARELHSGNINNSKYGWTSGDQSDQGHRLDMGVVIPETYSPELISTDPHTHLFTLTPIDGKITYRYTSAWEFDHTAIADFEKHVQETAGLLTTPPIVVVRE